MVKTSATYKRTINFQSKCIMLARVAYFKMGSMAESVCA
jgi:hypothetical protein